MKEVLFAVSDCPSLKEEHLEALRAFEDNPKLAEAISFLLMHKQSLIINFGANNRDEAMKVIGVCEGLRHAGKMAHALSKGNPHI